MADLLRPGDDIDLVNGEDPAVPHEPSTRHHDRLHIARLAVVHEGRDDAERGHEIGATAVDHDEIGLLPYLQASRPLAEGERARPVAGRPLEHVLGLR
jgi:hypothetical protein